MIGLGLGLLDVAVQSGNFDAFERDLDYGYLHSNADDNATGVLTGYATARENTPNGLATNASTGRVTIGAADDYLIFANCFPHAATPGGVQFYNQGLINGAANNKFAEGGSIGNFGHGHSGGAWGIGSLSASDYLTLNLVGDGRSPSSYLGAIQLPASVDYFFARENAVTTPELESWTTVSASANWNGTTGEYTVPADGYYLVIFTSWSTEASGSIVSNEAILRVNGSRPDGVYVRQENSSSHRQKMLGHNAFLLNLGAGDVVDLQAAGVAQANGRFGIIQIPADMVMFSAYRAAWASAGAATTVTGWTERFDLGGVFNAATGAFTAPWDGSYAFFGVSEDWNAGGVETQCVIVTPNLTSYTRGFEAFAHREPCGCIVVDTLTQGQTVYLQAMGQGGGNASFGAIRIS